MGTTPVEMYKLFFGSQAMCPDFSEDAGLSCNCPDTQVSSPIPGHATRMFIIKLSFKRAILSTGVDRKSKAYQCPAPLPETTPDPVLTRMLEIAPLEEGEEGNKEATASAKEAVRKGGIDNSPNQEKKRTASDDPEAMASKRGKKSSSEGPAPEGDPAALRPQGDQLSTEL